MPQILAPRSITSDPFEIKIGTQVTFQAKGLQNADYVCVEVVEMSDVGGSSECCPSPVVLPEVTRTTELKCRSGATMRLTAEYPVLVLDTPQGVKLRLRLVTTDGDETGASVDMIEGTSSVGCAACACA